MLAWRAGLHLHVVQLQHAAEGVNCVLRQRETLHVQDVRANCRCCASVGSLASVRALLRYIASSNCPWGIAVPDYGRRAAAGCCSQGVDV